jgi:hypothetical protein
VKLALAPLKVLYQLIDALNCQTVQSSRGQLASAANSLVDLLTLLAHGSRIETIMAGA